MLFKRTLSLLLSLLLIFNNLAFADNPQTEQRDAWFFDTTNTSNTGSPSNLKYFKYYDILPNEINLEIFKDINISHLGNKKLYVGYGIVDPRGENCKTFPAATTGLPNDVSVCLPWWRIEREYMVTPDAIVTNNSDFLNLLRKQTRPPMVVRTCKQYEQDTTYPGGKVTCTSYMDRLAAPSCWDNPEQGICFVDNCGSNLKKDCKFLGLVQGEQTKLTTAITDASTTATPIASQTKTNLVTYQYNCPAGTITNGNAGCIDFEESIIYPYECTPDNPSTATVDESEYIYCNSSSPVWTGDKITGFNGKCADGRSVVCPVNRFANSTYKCTEPIYDTKTETSVFATELTRDYTIFTRNPISGEIDDLAQRDNCIRANNIDQARDVNFTARIVGNGYIDDDIYVLKHHLDGTFTKVYCNMQHAENLGSKKIYNGTTLQCIDNNGNYSFDQTVPIEPTDIVSIQQNSENENATGTPFALGRNHYRSTEVRIAGVLSAPQTFVSNFPYYPNDGTNLKTWDNTTSTLSLNFPFAGAYRILFYNKSNKLMASAELYQDDFKEISQNGYKQLLLGKQMALSQGINEDTSTVLNANRLDNWVEWGGGVYGGKHSVTGKTCQVPNDTYVKDNAIENIIILDLLTGSTIPIKMVYPLPYPNRVFVSRLLVQEQRKYHCYDDFPPVQMIGNQDPTHVCTANSIYQDYANNIRDNIDGLSQWIDNQLCEQNCRTQSLCSSIIQADSSTAYTCSIKGAQTVQLGGDLSGNLFSSQNACEAVCYTQNSCTQYYGSNCKLVEETPTNFVSDYTGKSIARKKEVAYSCTKEKTQQIGCSKYEVVINEGDISYAINAPGYETKNFRNQFDEAITKSNLLEQQPHLWSGWKGTCVKGKKWDFSYLSDPMTIASYAMSAYSSANWMANQSVAKEAANMQAANNAAIANPTPEALAEANAAGNAYADAYANSWASSWDGFKSSISSTFNSQYEAAKNAVMNSEPVKGMVQAGQAINSSIEQGIKNISDAVSSNSTVATTATNDTSIALTGAGTNTADMSKSMVENMQDKISAMTSKVQEAMPDLSVDGAKDWINTNLGINWDDYVVGNSYSMISITQGDLILFGAQSAFILSAPSVQDYKLADRVLKGYAGGDGDSAMQAYNSCMASIGASLPNLIGWSSQTSGLISSELQQPWNHPLRLTPEQLAAIASVTSQEYVMSHYAYQSTDTIAMSVYAIDAPAYLKAAQTVCLGTKVSQAVTHIQSTNEQNSSGGGGGGNVGLAIAQMALSMVCPPCGFAMKITMDLMTNVFASVNTCNNEEDAMSWDMVHYKTMKFNSHEQCVQTDSYCDKDTSWFGCVRKGYSFCCYDQITTKIFASGLKEQLGKGWEKCNDITIEDLKDISFRTCNEGEDPYLDKCFSTKSMNEFQQALFRQSVKGIDMGGLIEQVKNSMAIDAP